MQQATPPNESVGIRAPKACVPCAVAKVRCETDEGQIICKRDVSRLERKLDGVAAILAASDNVGLARASSGQTPPTIGGYIDQFLQSDDEAHLMLDIFRNELTPHFPFVVISPWVTSSDVRARKPFFFLTVMMITCRHDIPRQGAIAKAIREILSQRMLIKSEQSLDMLQGMLFYLAWYHTHLHLGTQLTNLLHLIMSLMIDLGLNRQTAPRRYAKPQREYFRMDGRGDNVAPRTLEERRTYLGCYCLTVVISMTARDFEPVRYTRYTEECCQLLSEAAEYPTDTYLVHVVRLLYLGDKVNRTFNQQEWDPSPTISVPVGAAVKSMEAELLKLKPSVLLLPPDTLQNVLLLMHYYGVETYLYEIALDEKVEASRYGSFSLTRLSLLFACLQSAKHFFDTFYALPSSTYFDLPYSTWTLVSHLNVVLSKLSLCAVDGWDHDYVSQTLNFHAVLDKLSAKVEEAIQMATTATTTTTSTRSPQENATTPNNNNALPRSVPLIFVTVETKIKEIKAVHDARKADLARRQSQHAPLPADQLQVADELATALPDDFAVMDSLDFFYFGDDALWAQNWP
ncbi:putative trna processing endoribonuclease protein [Cladophialophora carrionii]|uniref:Putative trna processing endoribonuclease protein n=1 Tax=Cladophialophora carrionii TaxID=86049 RepID=A0A1C1CN61_9EURO|nr:putative trna processing endoribonuclease protein [Cladophialophora carrionii]